MIYSKMICGKIAVSKDNCLSCGCEVYDSEIAEEHPEELAYIKEEQLYYFWTKGDTEEKDLYQNVDNGFELDTNWEPVISKEDLLKFEKRKN